MRKVSGLAFWASLLAVISSMGFAHVSSKDASESGVLSVQATRDPKDMSRAELTATVKRLDADLFGAYNDCELEKFGSFFPEHLEFYHDQTGGGPMTREQLVTAIKQNICGPTVPRPIPGRARSPAAPVETLLAPSLCCTSFWETAVQMLGERAN